ncbi:hypothetical protein V6N12_041500 [Hibiscus sabdariffa]|uniref:Uncharacterized protein n=1 Tax=Hibiscus sabdariffa TaxID=183260 RepID=A0ABR2AG48_9ROSI
MYVVGLDDFEIMWVTGSMVLLSFPDVQSRRSMLSKEVLSTWFGGLEEWSASMEAELVWVPTVEQREVVAGTELGDISHRSGRDNVVSAELVGGTERVVCDRGGVLSVGFVLDANVGARSWEGMAIEQVSMSVVVWDSNVGHIEGGVYEFDEALVLNFGENRVNSPSAAILGTTGASLAPIIGIAQGGARKVKSMKALVEALGSPAQHRFIVVAYNQRGHGRPLKVNYLVEASGDVVNASLTDSNIQARQRNLQSEANATLKFGSLIDVCTKDRE